MEKVKRMMIRDRRKKEDEIKIKKNEIEAIEVKKMIVRSNRNEDKGKEMGCDDGKKRNRCSGDEDENKNEKLIEVSDKEGSGDKEKIKVRVKD